MMPGDVEAILTSVRRRSQDDKVVDDKKSLGLC